jgi:MFS family permease
MLVARLPIGIETLALILFLRHEGRSFAEAGVAAGALSLGTGIGSPVTARLIDRLGPRLLIVLGCLHSAGLIAVVGLTVEGAPTALLVSCALLVGMTLPPISSVLRAAYRTLLADDKLIPSAFALEAVLTEWIFVMGPLAVAALVWGVGAAAALVLSAVTCLLGTAWFVAGLPPSILDRRAPRAEHAGLAGALGSPGLRTLVLAMLPMGFAFGAVEVMLPAFAEAQGDRGLAGVLIAIFSVGSMAGGLIYGVRPRLFTLPTTHLICAAITPIGLALLALATSSLQMAVLVVAVGLPIAPLIATRNELAGAVALPGTETEAFAWPLTALLSGIALGAAGAGALADGPGWRAAVFAATAAAGLGALVTFVRQDTLRTS